MELLVRDISGYLMIYPRGFYDIDRLYGLLFHTNFVRKNDYLVPKELAEIDTCFFQNQPLFPTIDSSFKAKKTFICPEEKIFEYNSLFYDYENKTISEYGRAQNVLKNSNSNGIYTSPPKCGGKIIEVDYTCKYRNHSDFVFIVNNIRRKV